MKIQQLNTDHAHYARLNISGFAKMMTNYKKKHDRKIKKDE